MLNSRIPSGPLSDKWSNFKEHCRLVSPNNKKKHTVLVVGTGLAGASAAATLAELGYPVQKLLYSRLSPPRPQHCRPGGH
jgi:succinate dehydrogenase / fumarate reductase flavoprotein subunit